ncbi:hypothetical protein RISK_000211 [Rhodopirellula islandica]|uniref:Type II toxin-antitoxin system RelE/ParE family toxin n=1 Tax=Rhodopirellula islandica TaxID=595434 RepID=A0A0J1EQD4_RHOIS|nr:hypothetical protein [Rhodopirellula islandica]KLU07694.1 hypothetical protein RISK_000211 [Rhodopirellula islandica]
MRIRLHEQAEFDLERGADFYESRESGIGAYFVDCLASDIESLKVFAGTHSTKFGFFRAVSKRFPYSIYYDVIKDEVVVFGVFGDRQLPEAIEASLRNRIS